MQSLVIADNQKDYGIKEAGPIVFALAAVIAMGGVAAFAILICGWGKVKSVKVYFNRWVEVTCK